MERAKSGGVAELPLDKAAEYMLEECRMVLPGIQALFGFQLIAVFSERFEKAVDAIGKSLHLAAIIFVVCAIALIMTPAALHRMTDPRTVSERYLNICTRLILAAMAPLATAIVIETWLVANILLERPVIAIGCAAACGAAFIVFWWTLPMTQRKHVRGGP